MPTKEQIKALITFDTHCQDTDRLTDKKLSHIYQGAKGTGYGWKGVAKEDPSKFWQAFSLINNH